MCSASQEIRVTRFAQPSINPLVCCKKKKKRERERETRVSFSHRYPLTEPHTAQGRGRGSFTRGGPALARHSCQVSHQLKTRNSAMVSIPQSCQTATPDHHDRPRTSENTSMGHLSVAQDKWSASFTTTGRARSQFIVTESYWAEVGWQPWVIARVS